MIAFVDFEASSLSPASYPIEVGWVFEDGSGASVLIKPEAAWTDWSAEAESVHGISRATLAAEGIPAVEVARRLVEVLDGHELYSDADTADQRWLGVLLSTAGLPPLPVRDIYGVYVGAVKLLVTRMPASIATSMAQSFLAQAEIEAERAVPTRHRAEADARRLFWTWRRLRELATEALDGWPG